MPPLVEVRNVSKVFGGGLFRPATTVALRDFSMAIEDNPPVITAVVGESGSGKTTLARMLVGFASPTKGSILFGGKDLRQLSSIERRRFRKDVQMILQDPFDVFNPFYKVDEVLQTPVAKFGLARGDSETSALIEEALRAVGLRPEETLGRYPHQLSGGQRQRVMVARALLVRPRLIVADEPVSMVDASLRATILESIRRLNLDFGISVIYITHDLTTAFQIGDNMIVLYRGTVAEAGETLRIIQQPQHPYTRLLLSSVPLPDPEQHWQRVPPAAVGALGPRGREGGCQFADRCPLAMAVCLDEVPPLFRTGPRQAVACHLFADHPQLPAVQLGDVLTADARPVP